MKNSISLFEIVVIGSLLLTAYSPYCAIIPFLLVLDRGLKLLAQAVMEHQQIKDQELLTKIKNEVTALSNVVSFNQLKK
jgi:hypothetical protein